MQQIQDIILERLTLLSPEYKEIMFSEYPEMTAEIFGTALELSELQTDIFKNGIMMYLMLFLDRAGLSHFLITECDVDPNLADSTVASIIDGLPLSFTTAQAEAYLEINPNDADAQATVSELTRVHILKQLQSNKVRFYQYVRHSEKVKNLLHSYVAADDDTEDTFITLLGDITLGFYKIEDTVPLLQQELGIDAKTAAMLGGAVLDLLAPLADPDFIPPTLETETTVNDAGNQNPIETETEQATMTAGPITYTSTPVVTNIPSVHTMATDANVARSSYQPVTEPEPTYRSEQPVIRKSLSDTPSYATPANQPPQSSSATPPIEPPRWGA